MRIFNWQFFWGALLLLLSAALYLLHFLIFKDAHHIFIYLLGDIAFIPIEVLIVTLIIHKLLDAREKQNRLDKLNVIIGVFFSEVGTSLLTYFSDLDPDLVKIKQDLIFKENWTNQEFNVLVKKLNNYPYGIHIDKVDLSGLKTFLASKRDFLLRVLENPYLMEHESFTDLLQSIFHLTEELVSRKECSSLKEKDCSHIENDIKRAYKLLVIHWLNYMRHLKGAYPFLFSLAMRTNPFDQTATPFIS